MNHGSQDRSADIISDAHANYFHEKHFNREAVLLHPGHYVVTSRDLLMVTILGSCVSVCFRDEVAGVSGMNHFMLPKGESSPFGAPARYGNLAMELLINAMLKAGAVKERLTAKVFGGARILSSVNSSNVGEQNCGFIAQYLSNEGVPIASQDLRGVVARKVFFFSETGRVLVKSVDTSQNALAQEEAYLKKINSTPQTGSLEIFS